MRFGVNAWSMTKPPLKACTVRTNVAGDDGSSSPRNRVEEAHLGLSVDVPFI
jgi:hypothetical protein